MRILFVGDEEEYRSSVERGEDGAPFSLFFCMRAPDVAGATEYDAMVVPALRYLSWPGYRQPVPLIASGPAGLARDCLELGCSDYIREPWTAEELYARVAARAGNRIRLGEGVSLGLRAIDGPAGSVAISDATRRILTLLKENEGHPVPRAALAAVLGPSGVSGRSIDMRIARLRSALRAAGGVDLAARLRCAGGSYQFIA